MYVMLTSLPPSINQLGGNPIPLPIDSLLGYMVNGGCMASMLGIPQLKIWSGLSFVYSLSHPNTNPLERVRRALGGFLVSGRIL